MKKLLILVVIIVSSLQAQNYVTQDFESGNRSKQLSICWLFPGMIFDASYPISGKFAGHTDQLTSLTDQVGIISPWIKMESGNITFKHKLTPRLKNGTLRRFAVLLQSSTQLAKDTIFKYTYALTATDTVAQTATIPVTKTGIYKVYILFAGLEGNGRAEIDELKIPGLYASQPDQDCQPVSEKVDSDKDASNDMDDDYFIDSTVAYNNYYPASSFGTLMYEDLWPAKGDYDFNDLVVDYQFDHITNASNKLVKSVCTFVLRAAGSSYNNGLAFSFDGLTASMVTSVEGAALTDGVFTVNAAGVESGQTNAVIPVFDNIFKQLPSAGGTGVNTDTTVSSVPTKTVTVTVTYQSGKLTLSDVSAAKFNPFMVINKTRGKEVHLPNKAPTNLASSDYFGKNDDDTHLSSGKYYKTKDNLPWALNITESIPYPKESIDLTKGYLKFVNWVISNGANYPDWYKNNANYRAQSKLYSKNN